ncbi:CYFA0S08e01816g1_1 [Cyberlindnera fabianii]|uniref:CYFA0S08e01816g1_1 n=1 Tax=Cyberlindnera fabianii TaxID=36022 RepID=A0A061AWA4_CYBFA|nr:hypothetical protein BON22_4886 [Cyberlindnera fabianii]CDR41940.1 CYFA0S08e01816g1_1 [Cyberlindnera fabianii]
MFNSISRAWNETADEGEADSSADHSVRFSPSTRGSDLRRRAGHYIHYDKPSSVVKNPLERLRRGSERTSIRRGSPRILKPVSDGRAQKMRNTENKSSSGGGLWGALGKLGKVFKTDDSELGTMKQYMNGMIDGAPENGTRRGVKRPVDLAKSRLDSIKQRADEVNQRAARFTLDNESPEKKRVKVTEPVKRPAEMRRIHLKDLRDLDSSRDNLSERVHRRRVHTISSNPDTTATSTATPLHSSLARAASLNAAVTSTKTYNIHDIPSSPMREPPLDQATPINGTVNDSVNISQSTLTNLTKKLELLENTVESLKEELKASNQRSQHLETSLNEVKREQTVIDNTILKSEEMEKINVYEPQSHNLVSSEKPSISNTRSQTPQAKISASPNVGKDATAPNTDDDEFEEVNRSLSPIKLDLHKFKYVK